MTGFSEIYKMFFYLIETDDNFWSLYNVSDETVMDIARMRAKNYLLESSYIISQNSDTDTNWLDFDEEVERFNFELTYVEKRLLSSLMMERHFERELSKLKVFEISHTPSDLNVFSPSASRKTFMDMFNSIKEENRKLLDSYSSRDRSTNQRLTIDHTLYDYSSDYSESE